VKIEFNKITLVGAFWIDGTNPEMGLAHYDRQYWRKVFDILKILNIDITEENPDVVNLAYGRDFLAENGHIDCTVLCHIFNPGPCNITPSCDGTLVSPLLNNDPMAWIKRIKSSGTKIAFDFGEEVSEIMIQYGDIENYGYMYATIANHMNTRETIRKSRTLGFGEDFRLIIEKKFLKVIEDNLPEGIEIQPLNTNEERHLF
jgi:hypothetical protein